MWKHHHCFRHTTPAEREDAIAKQKAESDRKAAERLLLLDPGSAKKNLRHRFSQDEGAVTGGGSEAEGESDHTTFEPATDPDDSSASGKSGDSSGEGDSDKSEDSDD